MFNFTAKGNGGCQLKRTIPVQTAKFLGDMTKFVTSNGDGQIKVIIWMIWTD